MSIIRRIFGAHQADEWCAEYSLIAARTLNQVTADLIVAAEKEIELATWKDGLLRSSSFVNDRIAPLVRSVAQPAAEAIIEEANRALLEIVDQQAIWIRSPENHEDGPATFEGFMDIASAAAPLAAGAATAAAIPIAAVTTTTSFFGLIAVTSISWPVVIGGGALAGVGLATGLVQSSRLWDKTQARLRMKVKRFIVAALMQGPPGTPSILEQIVSEFEAAAGRAKAV